MADTAWDRFKGLLGLSSQPEPDVAAQVAAQMAALQAQQAAAVQTNQGEQEFSLTGEVNAILKRVLFSHYVARTGYEGKVPFPVKDVSLSANGERGGRVFCIGDTPDTTPHGENVSLNVTLSRPATDYSTAELKNTILSVLGMIPALKGKVVAKPIEEKHATYADVEQELLPLLKGLAPEEVTVIKQFFEASPNQEDKAPRDRWDMAFSADHSDGKVQISINARELPSDKETAVSSDAVITEFFKVHHDQLLAKVKEKAAKLGVLKAEDLANLDMHVTATGWNIRAAFGTKPATDIDATTGQKMTPEQRAHAFTETKLATIDTNQLNRIFQEALRESTPKLSPLMARIMDPHMLADILRNRMPGDQQLEAFLKKHEMFLSVDEKEAKDKAAKAHDGIVVGEPEIYSLDQGSEKHGVVTARFDLPQGMTLQSLLLDTYNHRNQIGLSAQQQTQAAAGVAA